MVKEVILSLLFLFLGPVKSHDCLSFGTWKKTGF